MHKKTLKSVLTALFAALISAGALITIPLGPVPLVMQNAFAVLAGLLLGPVQGAGAVGLFLLSGVLGLPVFSGGKSGFAVLAGPTGGYLAGYFIAALVAGYAVQRLDNDTRNVSPIPVLISACLASFLSIYIPGVLRLAQSLELSLPQAIAKGFVPFIAADIVKTAILVPLVLKLRPVLSRYLHPEA